MNRSDERYEHLTDAELAMEVYLAIIRHDDELPDHITNLFWDAQHMASVLHQRLVGPYCQVEGCPNQHLPSFPWCSEHVNHESLRIKPWTPDHD